jgi:CO/xanthine dehydrogenase FAD-binding subunit
MNFTIASTLDEALAAVAAGARPVAGGSDLVVGARQGKAPLPESLVAIDRIESLGLIEEAGNGLRIGALVTHARLELDDRIVDRYTGLADASALVGSPSTRNVGTIGGNVMNASPAMDTGAPLLVLGAEAELQSTDASRRVDIAQLWTAPGRTSAAAGELCVAIHLPARPADSGSAYVRLEYRRAMEIAVVGAAASVGLDHDGALASLSLALTAVAPTIIAVSGTDALLGRNVDDALLSEIAALASEQAAPISDLRASDRYRRHCVGVMARRAVDAATRRARGESIAVPVNRSLGIGAAS